MCLVNKELLKNKLQSLISRYNITLRNRPHSEISEETIRTWLNEFLLIFGWDVQNTSHVLQERVLRGEAHQRLREINSPHRQPDYMLLNGNNIKTFIDTKSLDIDVFNNQEAAYQIRSYGWSAKVPCAFVTNFEQLVIFDTRFVPNPTQSATMGVIQLHIDDYLEQFDCLYDHLFYDNICANKLEEIYAGRTVEGRKTVDVHFMELLVEFRKKLAQGLFEKNPDVCSNNDLLNYYTQIILDRIVFIRVCESKGIEVQEKLRSLISSENGAWDTFKNDCYNDYYSHYDGAMFSRDVQFQSLKLNDDIICNFIERLYYPYPYKFDVIPVKVIANIYEEFLSNRLVCDNDSVKEVIKDEYVRANGVIPTPEHIVDMICKQTIKLSNINSINVLLNIKILDPCCGSGVFMISCYEMIAKRMVEIFTDNEIERNAYSNYYCVSQGSILLTIEGRKSIMANCIHGIDYDNTAVEVAKMSLALKIVDGNNPLDWNAVGAFGEQILKDISLNVRLGNTLVDVDHNFSSDEIRNIKPLNLRATFTDVFNQFGGFKYIVGNPPYVETKHFKSIQPAMHLYLKERYEAFSGKADLAVLFIERCIEILCANGKMGLVIQRRWFKTDYGKNIRRFIDNGRFLERLIDFGATDIFKGRTVYPSILILNRNPREYIEYYYMDNTATQIKSIFENSTNLDDIAGVEYNNLPLQSNGKVWSFENYRITELVNKYTEKWHTLGEYPNLQIKDGVQVLWKKAYHLKDVTFNGDVATGVNGFGELIHIESSLLRRIVYNKKFYPFKQIEPDAYCIFPYYGASNVPIGFNEIKNNFPLAYSYLKSNEIRIKDNVACRDGDLWHTYTREHNHNLYSGDKIIFPMTALDTIATFMPESNLYLDNSNMWFITIAGASHNIMKAITCIINSTIFSVLGKSGANPQAGGYYKFNKQFLMPIPFPSRNVIESVRIDELALLHDDIVDLQNLYKESSTEMRSMISGNLQALWEKVDNKCYELYEVTNTEKALIESVGRTENRVDLL